jgi:hypothetical protein
MSTFQKYLFVYANLLAIVISVGMANLFFFSSPKLQLAVALLSLLLVNVGLVSGVRSAKRKKAPGGAGPSEPEAPTTTR